MAVRIRRGLGLAAAACLLAGSAPAQVVPTRTPLAVFPIAPAKPVSRVETTRVDFLPGQAMPRHKHTVPVICFVSKGDFLVRIGDAPERKAAFGTATYEPPEVVIQYFRNASTTEPAQLECAVLAGDKDTVLNVAAGLRNLARKPATPTPVSAQPAHWPIPSGMIRLMGPPTTIRPHMPQVFQRVAVRPLFQASNSGSTVGFQLPLGAGAISACGRGAARAT
jgi:quercetin dioxygenase-like cupin family protein